MLFADILNIITVFLPIGPIFTVPMFTGIFLESTFQGFAHITNPLCNQQFYRFAGIPHFQTQPNYHAAAYLSHYSNPQ